MKLDILSIQNSTDLNQNQIQNNMQFQSNQINYSYEAPSASLDYFAFNNNGSSAIDNQTVIQSNYLNASPAKRLKSNFNFDEPSETGNNYTPASQEV